MQSILLLFLSLLFIGTLAQNEPWPGCVTTSQVLSGDATLQLDEPTKVCFNIGNSNYWGDGVSYVRTSFEPKADEYSKLHIPQSYRNLVQNPQAPFDSLTNNTITVGVVSQTALSFLRAYSDENNVYPFFTAIIDVEDGIIRGITWDDSCVFCNKNNCVETTYDYNGNLQNDDSAGQPTKSCFITKEACDELIQENPSATECDLTLYVVWSGTDKNGKAFQSQAFRFSEFPVQDLSDRLASTIPSFNVGNPFS